MYLSLGYLFPQNLDPQLKANLHVRCPNLGQTSQPLELYRHNTDIFNDSQDSLPSKQKRVPLHMGLGFYVKFSQSQKKLL